jgi:SAM-dependent methyltransferase
VQDYLASVIDRIPSETVEILDVGAGPMTVLGKVHPGKSLAITATDPLAREYNRVLARCALEPPVRTEPAEAEKLSEQLGDRRFDIVHARNSLDHSADPVAGVEQMLAVTRPGGFVVLLHLEKEGERERYLALHKWDFFAEDGRLIIAGPGPGGPRRDISAMLAGRAEVECSIRAGEVLAVIRKPTDPKSGELP